MHPAALLISLGSILENGFPETQRAIADSHPTTPAIPCAPFHQNR